MDEVGNGGEGANEGWDIGSGVEQRGILLDEQVGHFPAPVRGPAEARGRVARGLDVRLIDEGLFFTSDGIEEGGQKGLGAVGEGEGQGLYVLADAVQRGHAGGFGEDAGAESDLEVGEQERCCADAEVVAR